MVAAFVVFSDPVDDEGPGDPETVIRLLGDFDRVAIAEQGELAAYLCQQVAIIVADREIPIPNIAINVENHAVGALDFEAFAEQSELLVHAGPKLTIAVDFVVGQ